MNKINTRRGRECVEVRADFGCVAVADWTLGSPVFAGYTTEHTGFSTHEDNKSHDEIHTKSLPLSVSFCCFCSVFLHYLSFS